MKKIEYLNKLVTEANEAYKQSIMKVLDEIVPGLDMEARQQIATKICWDKHGFMDSDEIILMQDGRAFENPAMADLLTARIQQTREQNKDVKPYIDKNYWCETCGSHSHETHPLTGYCYHCNTDNWEPEDWREMV